MNSKIMLYAFFGVINTLISYVTYVTLLLYFPYSLSYTVAYTLGIFISYLLNTYLTFKTKVSIKKATMYPLVYLLQYLVGIVAIHFFVKIMNAPERFAIILVVLITFPVGFLLSKKILTK